ncbi:MAG TPA: helix-turn-helix domain-containing protein [Polyangiaceae bacterium]|nr:helix-turn-helix domain-containing protein [Polyangiaceae bacterium]
MHLGGAARCWTLRDEQNARRRENATRITANGVSERTLHRLLVAETGLSFVRWRQQLHIVLAIQKLSRGAAVQNVAVELGYESASSFVTMFRKAVGSSPARYMAHRLASAPKRT